MSVLLGAMAGEPPCETVEQGAGRVEGHRWGGGRGGRAGAPGLARSDGVDGAEHVAPAVVLDDGRRAAGLVDRDRDDRAGEEPLVELQRRPVDVERAVLADAAARVGGERGRELVLVDRARARASPGRLRGLAEQPAMRRDVLVLVEER